MARKPNLSEDAEDEAPPLTDAELAEMRPARNVLSAEEFAAASSVRRAGRPPVEGPKVPVTIRLDPETVRAFRATGRGWQTRTNEVLAAAAAELPRVDALRSGRTGPSQRQPRHQRREAGRRPRLRIALR